ncbi:RagB/SusD family nutrient uptake outer membrane protein [Mangrovibacterium marinum]|uniref:Putative outer membrane starch-binding protein n=1 Tax=Mangrovibacterium marinum TaxID=1639118 RepID=A0A2T5C5F8_9BACT|nr:RagB/SusD family nutrient uptake outer membrane protein [Mangrovibacterium marinum]PTN10137.1 putative outer membrane starch-binding protein [Mangrovibacterium marinum]
MKKIYQALYLLFLAAAMVSCNDFLTIVPEDEQVLETYYTSEDAVNANTASLYSAYVWGDFDMNFMWMAGDELAGDLYYTYDQEGQFYYMTFNNGNSFLKQGWNGLFRVVSYCNNIINGMPSAAGANGISQDVIDRALGEARCIRGIAYYFLTEYWKDVPLITDNNISGDQVIRNTQASVYEFIRRDLVFASENLPASPFQSGRCSKYTALGMLAKLHLTMASHLDDAESAANFTAAKQYALQVINQSGQSLYNDLSTMFYPAGNNSSESLFSIQCTNDGYGYGNGRNVSLSRNALITLGSSWGAGKGPTLSLQDAFERGDLRRYYTYMRNGDSYDNLGGGGYDYYNFSEDESTETSNEMLAHVRKYVIGANSDCGGVAGASNQDAGNNIYLLRLADVYLCYVEACIGSGSSTDDATALDVFKQIRTRAGLGWSSETITYDQLIKERRVEFALESINFFDIKRMSYRDMNKALAYLNDMDRERQYVSNGQFTWQERNAAGAYHGGFTAVNPNDDVTGKGSIFYLNENVGQITVTASNLVLPIPAETLTKTPSITADPVDYEFN